MHYIAVLVPENGGGWSVIFPDLPRCATHGSTVHDAIHDRLGRGLGVAGGNVQERRSDTGVTVI
jgi:hypothetical protein